MTKYIEIFKTDFKSLHHCQQYHNSTTDTIFSFILQRYHTMIAAGAVASEKWNLTSFYNLLSCNFKKIYSTCSTYVKQGLLYVCHIILFIIHACIHLLVACIEWLGNNISVMSSMAQTLHLVSGQAIKQNSLGGTFPFTSPCSLAIYHSMSPYSSIMEQVYCAKREATEAADQHHLGLGCRVCCEHREMAQQTSMGTKGHLKAG